jgi:hypothetical protein
VQQLAVQIARELSAQGEQLGARWVAQARAAAPRPSGTVVAADPERNAHLCRALASSLGGELWANDEVMRLGWELGGDAYRMGSSLHDLLKEIDALSMMLLCGAQESVANHPRATAADGIGVARRLAQGSSLLVLAASKSFMHAHADALQQRYRMLRHDLRNPIGTIKGVVSLMEDPTISPETRNDPRFRSMVARNASTLDTLIGDQLSDAASMAPMFVRHDVSLRDVALAVRRELADEARAAGCDVEVTGEMPVVRADAASFELALRSVVASALRTAAPGSTVYVALRQLRDRAATVEVGADVVRADADPASTNGVGFASELSALTGGKVWHKDNRMCLEVPVSPSLEPRHDRARAD